MTESGSKLMAIDNLCYIFMATRQFEKANALLKRLIKENAFTATPEEVKRCEMILKDCPVIHKETNRNAYFSHEYYTDQNTGEELACRLRTLVLMGLWYQQGHSLPVVLDNPESTYRVYKGLVNQLRPAYLLNHQEKRAFFSLCPEPISTSIAYDNSQSEIYQLTRLRKLIPEEKIKQRIRDIKPVYQIKSQFQSKTMTIPLQNISNRLLTESIKFDTHPLNFQNINITIEELKALFPSLMYYFMHTPSAEDLEVLKFLILQTEPHDNDPRYPLLVLLYATYQYKEKYSYQKLLSAKNFNELFDIYKNEKIEFEITKLTRKRYIYQNLPTITSPAGIEKVVLQPYEKQKNLSFPESFEIQLQRPILSEDLLSLPTEQLSPNQGTNQFLQLAVRKSRNQDYLESINISEQITHYEKTLESMDTSLKASWQSILNQANAITTKQKKNAYRCGTFEILQKADLLNCYLEGTTDVYMSTCLISEDDAQELHRNIHQALHLELEKQWVIAYLRLLQQSPIDPNELIHHIQKNPSLSCSPALMHLQYNLGIILTHEQLNVIENALSSSQHYQLITLPMGSGKTKVLLPCLANHFANGQQLSLIEVPQSLLESTYQDFKATCLTHFNKTVYLFTFERWKNINPDALKRMFEHLETVIIDKNILMSSPDAIQSLMLQYIELLQLDPITYAKEINYLSQIIEIFLDKTQVIMDEAHQVLSPHTVHNFSLGIKKPVPPQHIHWLIHFYQYIHQHDLKTSADVLDKIFTDPNHPLYTQTSPKLHCYLSSYFNNEANGFAAIEAKANQEEKELLAFYRLQLIPQNDKSDSLFDKVQQLKLYVDYGPSDIQTSPLEETLAIPYETNNTPLEHSTFSFHWMTMHCTIQMLFQREISLELFSKTLESALKNSDLQFKINRLFQEIDVDVNFLSIESKTEIQAILTRIQSDKKRYYRLCCLLLEEQILPQILIDTKILSQNSFQHLHSLHRAILVTGTMGEPLDYSHELHINDRLTQGHHQFLIDILETKNTPILHCDIKHPLALLKHLQEQQVIQAHFSAIMDVHAHFNGQKAEDVASAIADFLIEQASNKTHVLFFNKKNQLCAMTIQNPRVVKIIGGTSPQQIKNVLGKIEPEQYFMYYDQAHTFGVDIVLEKKAFALVLTDDEHDFSQGCTRLRGLAKEQSLSIIVPTQTKAETLLALDANIQSHQEQKIRQSIIDLTIKKCENVIYQQVLRKVVKDQSLFSKAQSFLVSLKSLPSLYETWGKALHNENTMLIIQSAQAALLRAYKNQFDSNDITELHRKMADIILSLPKDLLPETYPQKALPSTSERTINLSLEQQKSHQISHVHSKEKDKLKQAPIHPEPEDFKTKPTYQPLNGWLNTTIFSPNLLASQNLMESYKGQSFANLQVLKPALIIEYQLEGPTIKATLLCVEEYQPPQDDKHWYTTSSGMILSGNPPSKWLQSREYLGLQEQIKFFNGDLDLLEKQAQTFNWLLENFKEKMHFYRSHLQRLRETSPSLIDELYRQLKTIQKVDMMNQRGLHPHFEEKLQIIIQSSDNASEAWQILQDNHWEDYPLRLSIFNTIKESPQIPQSFISSLFSSPINDDKILEILQHEAPLSTEEIQKIMQYIEKRGLAFKVQVEEKLNEYQFPYRTIDDFKHSTETKTNLKRK